MALDDAAKLQRLAKRLASLPSIALPTDYPRPPHSAANKVVEASITRTLDDRTALALARLGMHEDEEAALAYDEGREPERPTPFHLLLTAFLVLLHRYTGETDIVVATSSPSSDHIDPLLLRAGLQPGDSFWSLVRRVGFLERSAGSLVP